MSILTTLAASPADMSRSKDTEHKSMCWILIFLGDIAWYRLVGSELCRFILTELFPTAQGYLVVCRAHSTTRT